MTNIFFLRKNTKEMRSIFNLFCILMLKNFVIIKKGSNKKMKTNEEFYGRHLVHMEHVKDKAVIIAKFAAEFSGAKSSRIVSRIKTADSMEKKIIADGLPINHHSALVEEGDAIGVRIITDTISDVYKISEKLDSITDFGERTQCRVLDVKDYILNPKESGYRSLHIIMGITSDDKDFPEMKVEFQIRTSIMDCWASLEHLAKYKQVIDLTPEVEDMLDTYQHAAEREIQSLDCA